jgi:hypothetical protein
MRVRPPPLPLGPVEGRLTSREWTVLVLGALAITVFVCLREPDIFGTIDWVRMHSLYKAYIHDRVAHGQLPLWNPYHWLGRPFLADIESAFFYPPEALYFFLDAHIALPLTCALHFLLCLYGAVKLARALGAERVASFFVALVIGSGVPLVGCFTSGLVHYGQALCWTPLVFYLGMRVQAGGGRRDLALLALALGLQILCGHPQAAWITQVGLAVLIAGRRLERPLRASLVALAWDLARAGAAVVLALALAAVAVLPLVELTRQGNRAGGSPAFAGAFAEPSYGWASLLIPSEVPFFHFQANGQLYIGLIPLLAGLAGLVRVRERNVRALLLLALFATVVALGPATPLFTGLYYVVPGLGWLRDHARMTFLIAMVLALAGGLFLSARDRFSRRAYAALVLLAAVVCAIVIAFCLRWPDYAPVAARRAFWRAVVVVLAAGVLATWMRWGRAPKARLRLSVVALVFILAACDLALAVAALKHENRDVVMGREEAIVRRGLVAEGMLVPGQPPPRVFIPSFRENAGMVQGWSTPYGYSALAPARVWKYMHEAIGLFPPMDANTFPSLLLARRGPFPYRSMSLVAGVDPRTLHLAIERNPDPRAYLATGARLVANVDEAIRLMREGHDFHRVALVERPLALPAQAQEVSATAAITDFQPEHIEIDVETPVPALLVVGETWFPGWQAEVNGARADCVPTNAWMRGVPVPAGKHHVVLRFHSTYLLAGAAISLAALAAILTLLVRGSGASR